MAHDDIYPYLQRLLGSQNKPIIIECGAFQGHDTVRLFELLRQPRIVAFEPDPRNLQFMERRGITRIAQVVSSAIAATTGKATFYLSSGTPPWRPDYPPELWSGSSSLRNPKTHLDVDPWCKFDQQIEVDVVTLDWVLPKLGIHHVDFIWADIQGAEGDMIRGGQSTLAQTRYLYTEYSNQELYEGQDNLETLMGLLPGAWELVHNFGSDVLLRNSTYEERFKRGEVPV